MDDNEDSKNEHQVRSMIQLKCILWTEKNNNKEESPPHWNPKSVERMV